MQVWAAHRELLLTCKIHLPKQLPTHLLGAWHGMTSLHLHAGAWGRAQLQRTTTELTWYSLPKLGAALLKLGMVLPAEPLNWGWHPQMSPQTGDGTPS